MRVAVISDVHGNLEAFRAVLADIRTQAPDRIICLGDTVGYGPDPQACLDLLRESDIASVLGNHELALIKTWRLRNFNPTARRALRRTAELLRPQALDFIRTLPPRIIEGQGLFVHGLPPRSVTIYLHEVSPKELAVIMRAMPTPLAFVGHTHELALVEFDPDPDSEVCLPRHTLPPFGPTVLRPASRHIVNVGSVGLPRDGQNDNAKYVIWDDVAGIIDVRTVPYDVEATVRRFRSSGLPLIYAERLTFASGRTFPVQDRI